MKKALFRSIIAKNSDTQTMLAEALKLPQSALSHRINGKVDFRVSEIECIRKRYKLTDREIVDIFFAKGVS